MTKLITAEDVLEFKRAGSWKVLEELAHRMIQDAQTHAGVILDHKLGGGTRLMLALEHRISNDIDLFIRDPQWIGYLTPRLNDRFEDELKSYDENAVSLKLLHADGEIDFIVGMSLLGLPDESSPETKFCLEPVAEVLAKKLFYRGWALTPRDLFDWWALETMMPSAIPFEQIALLLKTKVDEIRKSLGHLNKSSRAELIWGEILAPEKPDLRSVVQWADRALERLVEIESDMKFKRPSP